jgi:hypothetical protein
MSPRESIRMTGDEMTAFLQQQPAAVLARLLPDGQPDAAIVPSRFEEGALALSVDDVTLVALAVDDRVCCAVEVCPSYYEIRGVSVHGRAVPAADGSVHVTVDDATSFDFGKIRARPA